MNEIIQSLEANATNGKENFCYISENKLKAIKELSKREQQENQLLKDRIEKAIEYINWWVDDNKKQKIGLTFAEADGLLLLLKEINKR